MNGDKIVACDVVRYDVRKNIFVADKKFISVEKCFEIRVNGSCVDPLQYYSINFSYSPSA